MYHFVPKVSVREQLRTPVTNVFCRIQRFHKSAMPDSLVNSALFINIFKILRKSAIPDSLTVVYIVGVYVNCVVSFKMADNDRG